MTLALQALFDLEDIVDANRKLRKILEIDRNRKKVQSLDPVPLRRDANHLERRQHQRAISDVMIEIALMYGKRNFSRGALVFTLNDRNLQHSPYCKFVDFLRGLRVVCLEGPPHARILTAYWDKKTKRRARK